MEVPLLNTPTTRSPDAPPIIPRPETGSLDTLGQGDFLTLLIAQLQQQDPFEPVDNKDMLSQMAQFSALAGSTETNATLSQIVERLDTLIDAQTPAPAAPPVAPAAAPTPETTDPITSQE